jgi:hypothetical protein
MVLKDNMALRRNIDGYLTIALTHFQEFDQGQEVQQNLPFRWNLQPGDKVEWECGHNHNGIAEIIRVGRPEGSGTPCIIRKVL